VADERWIERLIRAHKDEEAIAAGGRMTPLWVAGKPSFLPEEFYWLVGVTHRGFAEGPGEVRNTFGSNISFRADVFEALDGFDTDIGGRKGDRNLQGGETELCARLHAQYGRGVWYEPGGRSGPQGIRLPDTARVAAPTGVLAGILETRDGSSRARIEHRRVGISC